MHNRITKVKLVAVNRMMAASPIVAIALEASSLFHKRTMAARPIIWFLHVVRETLVYSHDRHDKRCRHLLVDTSLLPVCVQNGSKYGCTPNR